MHLVLSVLYFLSIYGWEIFHKSRLIMHRPCSSGAMLPSAESLPTGGWHADRKRLSGAMQYTCGTLDGYIRLRLHA